METTQNQPRKEPDKLAKEYAVARAFLRTELLQRIEFAREHRRVFTQNTDSEELVRRYWTGYIHCAERIALDFDINLED